ncbi:9734_t:CDS:2, partial [Paraglomus brasilianum]
EKFDQLTEDYLAADGNGRRKKSLITQEVANMIISVLNNPETTEFDAQFRHWARRKFLTRIIRDNIKLINSKNKKPVCIKEELYDVIGNTHHELQHAGYKKTFEAISDQYSHVPRELVGLFVSVCTTCTGRRRMLPPVSSKPIISKSLLLRVQ